MRRGQTSARPRRGWPRCRDPAQACGHSCSCQRGGRFWPILQTSAGPGPCRALHPDQDRTARQGCSWPDRRQPRPVCARCSLPWHSRPWRRPWLLPRPGWAARFFAVRGRLPWARALLRARGWAAPLLPFGPSWIFCPCGFWNFCPWPGLLAFWGLRLPEPQAVLAGQLPPGRQVLPCPEPAGSAAAGPGLAWARRALSGG